jgi:hypothetical protein
MFAELTGLRDGGAAERDRVAESRERAAARTDAATVAR